MIAKGTRVKLTEAGRALVTPRVRDRLGTVTGRCRESPIHGIAYLVLWDGLFIPQPWHFGYLEPVESPLTPSCPISQAQT